MRAAYPLVMPTCPPKVTAKSLHVLDDEALDGVVGGYFGAMTVSEPSDPTEGCGGYYPPGATTGGGSTGGSTWGGGGDGGGSDGGGGDGGGDGGGSSGGSSG